jgi:hypothetical protein
LDLFAFSGSYENNTYLFRLLFFYFTNMAVISSTLAAHMLSHRTTTASGGASTRARAMMLGSNILPGMNIKQWNGESGQ